MKFTEEKAVETVKKFNLSGTTIAVWKLRGSIPDKYFKEGYKTAENTSPRIQKKIVDIVNSEKLNIRALAQSSNMQFDKFQDVKRGKSSFNTIEVISIRKAINAIRVEGKKHVDNFARKGRLTQKELDAFKTYLANTPELVISKIFDKKFIDWRNGKPVVITFEDQKKAIDNLSVFILETSIPEA
jgi:hypothetical protein